MSLLITIMTNKRVHKKILRRYINQIKKVLLIIKKRFLRLFLGEFREWGLYTLDNALSYKFEALYCGIRINKKHPLNESNFRRNIHRLEKGLSHSQIKETFADKYILKTVEALKRDYVLNDFGYSTRAWGYSVLNCYFNHGGNLKNTKEAYELFKTIRSPNLDADLVPYNEQSRPTLSVKYNSLYALALRRRSIRFYLDKSVEPDVIKKAMKIAAFSPSACNRQSFKFLFFNKEEFVQKVLETAGGISGYEIPSVVIVVGSYGGYFDERDINVPIIDSSLAIMAFLFALETLGLSSVCINWANVKTKDEKIRQLLMLEKDDFIVLLIGVGYPSPDGKIPSSVKKDVGELLLINERIIET